MIGIWTSSGSGTSSTSGASVRSATTRCALYDGSRSTRHCGRQSLSQQQTRSVGSVVVDQPGDEVQQPAHRVDRRAVGGLDLRHPVERPEVHRGGVEEHQARPTGCWVTTPHPATARMPYAVRRDHVRTRSAPTGRSSSCWPTTAGCPSPTSGKATGLSTSAVHQRVKRLESRGLIQGYGATIDHEQLGLPLTAFISIRPIDPSQPDDSPERVRDIPEIESCWSVAGDESYILKVRVADAGRPRGPAGPDPRRRERLHAHHDRAVHAVRGPPGQLTDRGVELTRPGAPPYAATPRRPRPP